MTGVYVENGTHDGRPKYTEQNKEDGSPFLKTIGAEIIYCKYRFMLIAALYIF